MAMGIISAVAEVITTIQLIKTVEHGKTIDIVCNGIVLFALCTFSRLVF